MPAAVCSDAKGGALPQPHVTTQHSLQTLTPSSQGHGTPTSWWQGRGRDTSRHPCCVQSRSQGSTLLALPDASSPFRPSVGKGRHSGGDGEGADCGGCHPPTSIPLLGTPEKDLMLWREAEPSAGFTVPDPGPVLTSNSSLKTNTSADAKVDKEKVNCFSQQPPVCS